MNTFTQAIENVCDKRHARLMQMGLSENEAAQSVVAYLDHLVSVWKKNKKILSFVEILKQAYSYRF